MIPTRQLGNSGIEVSPVAMGCWPIAGITSLNVNDADSLKTLCAALDYGVTHFDTAHCYGYDGESERLIARALGDRRKEFSLATKVGIAYGPDRVRRTDGRAESIRKHFETSLQRLNTDRVELLYLHSPDPSVPLTESAEQLAEIKRSGKAIAIGLSNATLAQMQIFHKVCPLAAIQIRFNMLQREGENELIPWCQKMGIAVMAYWPLMKGLLAGRLTRDHQFATNDPRLRYPIFQGDLWQANQDFVDELRTIAMSIEKTVAQVVVNWTIHRPGITAALCGAKRPDQIVETAAAMGWQLDAEDERKIEQAFRRWQMVTQSEPNSKDQ